MKGNARGPILIAVTAVLWSFGGLFIKMIPWGAMTIIGMRAVFAAAILAIYMRKPRITFSPSVILGAICMAGTTILFVFANKLTTAANAIVLQYTGPIFVIILSIIFFKKRPRALDVGAVLATFIGIALLVLGPQVGKSSFLGNALACLSGLTFAGVFLINQMPNAKPEESLLLGHLINIVICLPFIVTDPKVAVDSALPWIAITVLGIFQLGLAYVLFSIGIKITPPITASLIAAIEPLLNPVWVFLVKGERPGALSLVGGAIVLLAVVLYSVLTMRQQRRVTAIPADTGTGM